LRIEDNILDRDDLVDEATVALFWEAIALSAEKALPCFWE